MSIDTDIKETREHLKYLSMWNNVFTYSGGIAFVGVFFFPPIFLLIFPAWIAMLVFGKKTKLAKKKLEELEKMAVEYNKGKELAQTALPDQNVSNPVQGTIVEKPATSDGKTCPMCAEQVKVAAKICRFCKHEFTA